MIIAKPAPTEYPPYYDAYIKKVAQNDLLDALRINKEEMTALINSIPIEQGSYRYAEGKWSVKEVLIHIMDAERIFAYRALTFARKDKNELPGFNEDEYVPNSGAENRTLFSIHDEFVAIRDSSITLFNSFNHDMLTSTGVANKNKITVRSLGYIIAGHAKHHIDVIKERYLTNR